MQKELQSRATLHLQACTLSLGSEVTGSVPRLSSGIVAKIIKKELHENTYTYIKSCVMANAEQFLPVQTLAPSADAQKCMLRGRVSSKYINIHTQMKGECKKLYIWIAKLYKTTVYTQIVIY